MKRLAWLLTLVIGAASGALQAGAQVPPPFLLAWGSLGSEDGQFNLPRGIAVDESGNVYVAEQGNHRVQKFDGTGNFILKWGTLGSADGQLHEPLDVAIGDSIYVGDHRNHRIQKFTDVGGFVRKWGSLGSGDGEFRFTHGVAVAPSGHVYAADIDNDRIQKFDLSGNFILKWGSLGSGEGEFDLPVGVAVDADGNVYVADTDNHRIQKFDGNGNFILKWGSFGSGNGEFNNPRRIAFDVNGDVYVTDFFNDRVQVFDSDGDFILTWGTTGSGEGEFEGPSGIAIDQAGDIYVSDTRNHRIQKFGPPNRPPDCSKAVASMSELWPPDHQLVPVRIVGVTDPDDDPVRIAVIGVTQDEPLDVPGDGNTCPDAILVAGAASVRSERSGRGNGRVYEVSFTAEDGRGGSCVGAVKICVPRDQRGQSCADDGQTVNSFGPCGAGNEGNRHSIGGSLALLPEAPEFAPIRPNPSMEMVRIRFGLPRTAEVALDVFDGQGRKVKAVTRGIRHGGWHEVSWGGDTDRGASAGAGLYFIRLRVGQREVTQRVVWLR